MFDSYTETSLSFDPALCINCRRCTQVCPHAVFTAGQTRVIL
ncbi:MAG TPA: 4Fe-4S binding protein, partial [Methanocorpusculum sp.]|nr:4Fe-4S binding protein [Methanocorpusculum sp.]